MMIAEQGKLRLWRAPVGIYWVRNGDRLTPFAHLEAAVVAYDASNPGQPGLILSRERLRQCCTDCAER